MTPFLPYLKKEEMRCSDLLSFRGFILLWLAILNGIIWTQKSLACPTECACERGKVDCTGKNLLSFPRKIPMTTKALVLSNNNLTALSPIRTNFLSDLVFLDCSYNQLTMDLPFTFISTVKLIYLDLSFNRIAYISHYTLSQLGKLMLLNLSGNPTLKLVETTAFSGNPMLTYLDFSGCGLQHIENVFENLSLLNQLWLNNNPWRCDCALLDLSTWLEETTIELPNSDTILCDEPKSFRGLQIFGAVQEKLHISCLVHLEVNDFTNMTLIAFCIFSSGIFAAWLVGIFTVMYYHPTLKADDESDDEEYRMI